MGRWAWRTQDSARLGRGQSQMPYLATVGSLPVHFFLLNTHFILFSFVLLCIWEGEPASPSLPPLLLQPTCGWGAGAWGCRLAEPGWGLEWWAFEGLNSCSPAPGG